MIIRRRLTWKVTMGALVLALILVFTLTGCGSRGAQEDVGDKNNQTIVEETTDENQDNNEDSTESTDKNTPTDNQNSGTKTDPATAPSSGSKTGASTTPSNVSGTAPSTEKATKLKLTLYFSDKQVSKLVPEVREVEIRGKRTAEAVMKELIKGPKSSNLSRTVPQETKLLSLKAESGVVYVNLSKEFQTKHWGGSAGDTMTLYSITNSLAELPGVQKVQFLIEGKTQQSILGHTTTSHPLTPNWGLVKK